MEDFETLSADSGYDEKEYKGLFPIRESTLSSMSSLKFSSAANSPKESYCKSVHKASGKLKGLRKVMEEVKGGEKRMANKVSNFQERYLEMGLWPEVSPKEQAKFKLQYQALKTKLSEKSIKIQKLKNQALTSKKTCKNCKILEKKSQSTAKALKEAINLSTLLLHELKKVKTPLASMI